MIFGKLFNKRDQPIFRVGNSTNTSIEVCFKGTFQEMPGVWPLVDENFELTPFVSFGTKSTVPPFFTEFKKKHKNRFKYIYNCQAGPFLTENYKSLFKQFDGLFDLDYSDRNVQKSLFCNHSMMARSMPYKDFFWEPTGEEKLYDFSLLTWGPLDTVAKRWDRGEKICDYLCQKGLKGLVVTQRGKKEDLMNSLTRNHIESGNLVIKEAKFNEIEFHNLMCKAKVGIFPNQIDAFPKHIIETLLADKPIVVSDDLLLGKEVLAKLDDRACKIVSFDNEKYFEDIHIFIDNMSENVSPREEWLKYYDFDALSKQWANEFNRLFETDFQRLFFMNHIPRIRENQSS